MPAKRSSDKSAGDAQPQSRAERRAAARGRVTTEASPRGAKVSGSGRRAQSPRQYAARRRG